MMGFKKGQDTIFFQIIKIDSIPDEIEQRQAEKICLSNLLLEYFRFPSTRPHIGVMELVCSSFETNDQLHDGKPQFYIVFYLTDAYNENVVGKYRQDIDAQFDAIQKILNRMGYMTSCLDSESAQIMIPEGLVKHADDEKRMFMVSNTEELTQHQLLSIGMTAAYDNLIDMMSDMPNAMFSVMLKGSGGGDDVECRIQVFSREKRRATLLYLNFVQGMNKSYSSECYEQDKFEGIKDFFVRYRLNDYSNFVVIGYKEFSNMLQLPFGRRSGMPITPQQRRLPLFQDGLINGENVSMGDVIGSYGKKLTLPLQSQVNHMAVLGISGSGKSNFLLYYLNEMYNKYDIPFLVIDPVSTEFRTLKGSLKDKCLNVFTPGSEVSPFEFNLFALSNSNLSVREYKLVLKDYLRNCLQLFSPLDKLIDETVDAIFLQKGWLDISTKDYMPGKTFTIDDFIMTFNKVFEKSNFKGNLANIASSGRVRLNALRSYFNTVATLPVEDIMGKPTVVELGKLQSAEAKSTMLLYLLNMVKLYMMDSAAKLRKEKNETQVRKPKLILVIDEAHSILEMQEQGEGMNIAQRGVVNTINQLLLEFRKYGLSVVIADQRVSVLQDVLTNTHVQVVFKQIDPVGKQVVSDIISLDEVDMLSMLKRGEAFVKHEQLETPVQVKMPKYDCVTGDTLDERVKEYMETDFWNVHSYQTRPFEECKQCYLINEGKICSLKMRSVVSNIAEYFIGKVNSREELKNDILDVKSQTFKKILEIWNYKEVWKDEKEQQYAERCLRLHLLHAIRLQPSSTDNGKESVTKINKNTTK